jgi:hypothetical protein
MAQDTPNISYGVQEDYKQLYKSNPEAALRTDVTIQAGYGILEKGTVLAENVSAAGNVGKFVPYNPTTFTGAETHPGRAYLVQDGAALGSDVYVTMNDSYKFAVGDDLIINDDTTTAENLGAITAIDRTTYPHMAKITFTTAVGATAFTTARFAYVCVEAGTSNNYSDAVCILEKSVDTGSGSGSAGANADVILKNALLYEGLLTNCDSTAKTALSASSFGQFLKM